MTETQAEQLSVVSDLLSRADIKPERRALWLSGKYEPEFCQAAVDLLQAREKAAGRYPFAERMYFTKNSLEQATDGLLAYYHASLFPNDAIVLDAGCGSGIDSIALAKHGSRVVSVDIDPVHCIYTRMNSQLCDVADRLTVVHADLMQWPVSRTEWLFADPMRRSEQGRLLLPEQWKPPLSFYLDAGPMNGVVKASPMLKPDRNLLSGRQISYLESGGECKEAMISWGACSSYPGQAVAVHIGSGSEIHSTQPQCVGVKPIGRYLYDPSASVLAADLLPQLAHQILAWRLSPYCGYLSGDKLISSPFARAYEVVRVFKYRKSIMKSYLSERSISQVIIKKRGLPADWGHEWVMPDAGGGEIGLFAAFPVQNRLDVWVAQLSNMPVSEANG
ncbi:MAG: 50S ribosomal protein L11 methyltransferase [Armatimonadota bacterium]